MHLRKSPKILILLNINNYYKKLKKFTMSIMCAPIVYMTRTARLDVMYSSLHLHLHIYFSHAIQIRIARGSE